MATLASYFGLGQQKHSEIKKEDASQHARQLAYTLSYLQVVTPTVKADVAFGLG
ncbi:hypothetical protein QJS10_CPB20g00003 [Acorus calamus]|uniref:Uncharacterized protein n=1 Tax=Acorus calamus TaxID=4465 RepID=A0AAV9CCJ9_ACOCL|nr:hypothetical protein QJS10_CPB20g00003 [Acorus calamus]